MALLQKHVIARCNRMGKPVMITRVVDTMVSTPRPTRAEATGALGVPGWWEVSTPPPPTAAHAAPRPRVRGGWRAGGRGVYPLHPPHWVRGHGCAGRGVDWGCQPGCGRGGSGRGVGWEHWLPSGVTCQGLPPCLSPVEDAPQWPPTHTPSFPPCQVGQGGRVAPTPPTESGQCIDAALCLLSPTPYLPPTQHPPPITATPTPTLLAQT